jgi:hypothetical protein
MRFPSSRASGAHDTYLVRQPGAAARRLLSALYCLAPSHRPEVLSTLNVMSCALSGCASARALLLLGDNLNSGSARRGLQPSAVREELGIHDSPSPSTFASSWGPPGRPSSHRPTCSLSGAAPGARRPSACILRSLLRPCLSPPHGHLPKRLPREGPPSRGCAGRGALLGRRRA